MLLAAEIAEHDGIARGSTSHPCAICGHTETVYLCSKNGYMLLRCRACELVFVANPPADDELELIYANDRGYHTELPRHVSAARGHLRDLQNYKRAAQLLEIGCAAGTFLKVARDAGWTVRGIELSDDTAEIARRNFGIDVTTGTLAEGIFAPRSFDAVVLWNVVEHLADPVCVLRIVKSILKDDGVLLMETPNVDGLFSRLSYGLSSDGRFWRHPQPPTHLFEFSKKSLQRTLEAAGLRTIGIADRRIPLSCSFGAPAAIARQPKRLAYTLAFVPVALIGPLVGKGDSMVVAAAKP
jgi:2-polyprenyl-3-methyl-5-hydroxy-6-metoxy-1,4-benzoquinol methylase